MFAQKGTINSPSEIDDSPMFYFATTAPTLKAETVPTLCVPKIGTNPNYVTEYTKQFDAWMAKNKPQNISNSDRKLIVITRDFYYKMNADKQLAFKVYLQQLAPAVEFQLKYQKKVTSEVQALSPATPSPAPYFWVDEFVFSEIYKIIQK